MYSVRKVRCIHDSRFRTIRKGNSHIMSIQDINVHQIIKNHSLPLYRNNQPIVDLLKNKYRQIYSELCKSVSGEFPNDFPNMFYKELKEQILPLYRDLCIVIVEIFERLKKNPTIDSSRFNEMMERLFHAEALRILEIEDGLMCRIRQGDGLFERKDLFHIPNKDRKKAPPQRYSRRNDLCLYLSLFPGLRLSANEMVLLSWQECNTPSRFYASFFMAQKKLYFLHLAKKGTSYLYEYDHAIDPKKKDDRENAIKQYLYTLPLRLACSIENSDKGNHDEVTDEVYLIPQMLMDWVKRRSRLHGIAYRSSLSNRNVKNYWSYNLAMPVRNPDADDGYDIELKQIFKVSQPIKCDIAGYIDELEKAENIAKRYCANCSQSGENSASEDYQKYTYFANVSDCFERICSKLGDNPPPIMELFDLRNEVQENLTLFDRYAPALKHDILETCYQITPQIFTLDSKFEYEYI